MRNGMLYIVAAALTAAACNGGQPARDPGTIPPVEQDRIAPPPEEQLPAPDTIAPALDTAAAPPAGSEPAQPGAGGAAPPRTGAPATPSPATPAPAAPREDPPATPDDPGAAVLQRAATAYGNLRSMKADFVMHFTNPLLRQETVSRGTLYQRRPDRIALRFSEPAGDVIVSDGEHFWLYYPSVNADQVIQAPAAASGESAVDLQAQFVGDPVRRFRYTLHGEESVAGRRAHVVTLEPRERAEYRSLKVWLDARDSLARRFEITEHNGTVRRFELSAFEINPNIPDATFRFTPPAGARIVRG